MVNLGLIIKVNFYLSFDFILILYHFIIIVVVIVVVVVTAGCGHIVYSTYRFIVTGKLSL